MPELRTDWLTGRWVIVAENRADRPNEFASALQREPPSESSPGGNDGAAADCPFCPGRESQTPPAAYERCDDDGHWRVRVVPNKYPAVMTDVESGSAVGAHEVVIESARHIRRVGELSVSELRDVLETYAERLGHWRADGRFRYGLVFKNVGADAGASLSHLHSQLIALADVPPAVERELCRAERFHKDNRSCSYCRLVDQERAAGKRLVFDRDGFVAFCPYASIQAHEVWIMPADHEPWFERSAQSGGLARLAAVLHAVVRRLETVVPTADYNLLLRTGPWIDAAADWCHWRIEVLPRAASIAGLELATAAFINPLPPERAARQLR